MANPTTNFGWVMPTSTSLVTNLPADFNTFGQGVDTSMAQLKGGTTGQILSKTSATDMAFTWITPNPGDITGVTAGTGISGGGTSGDVTITNSMATAMTTKGDLVPATGSGTFSRLAVGTNGQTLVADSSTATGLKWAAASSGALTLIQRSTFSGVANTGTTFDGIFSSTYSSYMVIIENWYAGTSTDDILMKLRIGSTTMGSAYNGASIVTNNTTSSIVTVSPANSDSFVLADQSGTSTEPSRGQVVFPFMGTAGSCSYGGQISNNNASRYYNFNGTNYAANAYTGLQFLSSSSNITGTISVYGLAKS